MSYIQSLKLVVSNRSNQLPPEQYRRNKLIQKLQEQLECIKARNEGRDYLVTVIRSVKNPETGTRQHVQMPYRIKPWWFTDTDGKTVLELRYGNKRIELAKGKTGIAVENLDSLTLTIEGLKTAIEKGELDSCLESTANALRTNIKK